jgi:flagellar protein FlaF
MFSNPLHAYESAAKSSMSNRDLEATALFKAARLLETCRTLWNEPDRIPRLFEALRYNQRLWTLFQTELVQPDHEMVPVLRNSLLRLSLFVDRRTFEIMAEPAHEKLQVLIDINRHLAEGLAIKPSGPQVPGDGVRN